MLDFNELAPEEGVQYRHDCPICGGKNSFSIRKQSGIISYNCFKTSCDHSRSRGNISYIPSNSNLQKRLHNTQLHSGEAFKVPDSIQKGVYNTECLELLKQYHAGHILLSPNRVLIGFDFRECRLCFCNTDFKSGEITGIVGRSLSPNVLPKSKIYKGSKLDFEIGTGKTAVIVEDIFSACSVSRDARYTGIPLCGTIIKPEHMELLYKYDKIIIALDKDASRKALKYYNLLKFIFKNVRMVLLEEDLKNCETFDLEGGQEDEENLT